MKPQTPQVVRSNSTPKHPQFAGQIQSQSSLQLCKIVNSYSGPGQIQTRPVSITQKFNSTAHVVRSEDQNLSTPQRQKINVFTGLKQPSSQNSDKRSSQSFNTLNHFQSENSSHVTPNRILKLNFNANNENERRLDCQGVEQIIKDNQSLQQTVMKYRGEAEHYRNLYIQVSKSVKTEEPQFNLQNFKNRIENLETVINNQQQEIEEWKEKYQRVQQDEMEEQQQKDLIAQLEGQVMLVIQENEQLNNQLNEQKGNVNDLEQKLRILIEENQRLSEVNEILGGAACDNCSELKAELAETAIRIKEYERLTTIQKQEITTWHETFQRFEKEQEKNIQKDNEIFQSRMRIQELETQMLKRSHSISMHRMTDGDKISELETHINKLEQEVIRLHQENPVLKREKFSQLVEEVLAQQLFYEDEIKRFRQATANQEMLKEQISSLKDYVTKLEEQLQTQNQGQSTYEVYDEFQRSTQIVQQLLMEIQPQN